jgi:two-component system nitrate/nitrite response regulator NarL
MTQSAFATVVVCRSALLREGLVRILAAAGFDVLTSAASVEDIPTELLSRDQSILLILHLTNDDATVAQIEPFKKRHPAARIALLHDHDEMDKRTVMAAFRAGVDAYFVNPNTFSLIKCLELVMLGQTILPRTVMSSMLASPNEVIPSHGGKNEELASEAKSKHPRRLSERQETILRCLVEGDSNKVIALKNNIAVATVTVHVKAILRAIGVANRTQAAMWAISDEALLGSSGRGESARSASVAEPSLRRRDVATATEIAPPRKTLVPQRATLLSERRLKQEQERRDAVVANVARLRELRETRDAAARTVPSGTIGAR